MPVARALGGIQLCQEGLDLRGRQRLDLLVVWCGQLDTMTGILGDLIALDGSVECRTHDREGVADRIDVEGLLVVILARLRLHIADPGFDMFGGELHQAQLTDPMWLDLPAQRLPVSALSRWREPLFPVDPGGDPDSECRVLRVRIAPSL